MIRRATLVLLIVSSSAVWADSWAPPSRETYQSPDNTARLTVTPRDLESSLAYFEDKVEGREPAGAPTGSRATGATAKLERLNAAGRWEVTWIGPLDNDVAPVGVVVTQGGRGFATLDNWHSVGYGPNVIAIYGGDGKLVRRLALTDLFPKWYIAALPHSVSSIQWRGEPRMSDDGRSLIVPVIQPDTGDSVAEPRTIDLTIRFADGAPIGLDHPEWKSALRQAGVTARESCAIQRQNIREWNAPISAPKINKEQDWHHYLRETQFRTKWSKDPPYPGTTVLRLPSHPEFKASVGWLEEALTEEAAYDGDLRAIGSPDIAQLTTEIERIALRIRAGQLKGVDLIIVADAAHAERVRGVLDRSGARLTIIDPAESFPQIKQRVQEEGGLAVCEVPDEIVSRATWWYALPFLALGGGLLMLRRG